MSNEAPVGGYGLLGILFFYLLNYLMGERKPDKTEAAEDAGTIAKNAVGAAFVDKATADSITGIATDVKAIRAVVEASAERDAEETLEKRLEDTIEHKLSRALDRLEHRDREHDRRHKEGD